MVEGSCIHSVCAREEDKWSSTPVSAEGQNESRCISSVVRAGLLLSGRESHLSTLGHCSSRGRRYKCLSSLTESAAAHCQIGQSMDVLTSMARAECTAYYKAKPCHTGCGYNYVYMHEFLASIFIMNIPYMRTDSFSSVGLCCTLYSAVLFLIEEMFA